MNRAFLSYCHANEGLVDQIAVELGRGAIVFDKFSFSSADEIKESILKGISRSSVYVFFASEDSIKSDWVKFELGEAEYALIRGGVRKAIAFIIDDRVGYGNLPEWLQRGKVIKETSARIIARDIRFHLSSLETDEQDRSFVGRTDTIEEMQRALIKRDESSVPAALIVSGLPGIGRRSTLRKAVRQALEFEKFVEIRVPNGMNLQGLAGALAAEQEPFVGLDELNQILDKNSRLSDEEAVSSIVRSVLRMNRSGEYPVIVDDGGLVDIEGYLTGVAVTLRRVISESDGAYIGVITSRRPKNEWRDVSPNISVRELSTKEIRHLIALQSNGYGVTITDSQVDDLADLVSGYPPAVYFALQQMKQNGIHLVTGGKSPIVGYLAEALARKILEVDSTGTSSTVLRLLAGFSPLPGEVVREFLSSDEEGVTAAIQHLLDCHLIVPASGGMYRIADPVRAAAVRALGAMDSGDAGRLANAINRYADSGDAVSFDLARVFLRSAILSGNKKLRSRVSYMTSEYYGAALHEYQQANYPECIVNVEIALEGDPRNTKSLNLLARAHIQSGDYTKARRVIRDISGGGFSGDAEYLTGFLERKRGSYRDAIRHFEQSGRTDLATKREMASCYLYLNDLKSAKREIDFALAMRPGSSNSWVLDLAIQIESRLGNDDEVEALLEVYRSVGRDGFVQHRVARIALLHDDPRRALVLAREAVERSGDGARVQFYSTWVICALSVGDVVEARFALNRLVERYPVLFRDIRLACECKCLIGEGRFDEALAVSENISAKDMFYYKKILLDAKEGRMRNMHSSSPERLQVAQEVEALHSHLNNRTVEDLIPEPVLDVGDDRP